MSMSTPRISPSTPSNYRYGTKNKLSLRTHLFLLMSYQHRLSFRFCRTYHSLSTRIWGQKPTWSSCVTVQMQPHTEREDRNAVGKATALVSLHSQSCIHIQQRRLIYCTRTIWKENPRDPFSTRLRIEKPYKSSYRESQFEEWCYNLVTTIDSIHF